MPTPASLILLLMGLLFSAEPVQARVFVNHGPAFISGKVVPFDFTQNGILGAYAAWNLDHSLENLARKEALLARADLVSSSKNIHFLPSDLRKNYLEFGYRDDADHYHDWSFVGIEYGYCHGMTLVTRAFAYLATFDSLRPAPYDYAKNPAQWLRYYQKLVDAVMKGEKTTFPGFANLNQFSKSAIAEYLERHVVDQWGINTVSYAMYENVYEPHFKKLDRDSFGRMRNELQYYLKRNFYPRIILGAPAYRNADSHVVMVTKINSITDRCVLFDYWNVGTDLGARMSTAKYCVGDNAWIPDTEYLYFLDMIQSLR
jgi:hypothetical protein